ncbi:MAG: serine/threonine-protein kinase [Deltaproteobacteria bacterium]|nr:serine/threonine-protein kinase [Deltaproteobacteria bacterium]
MDSRHWQRIKSTVEAALEIPRKERTEFLRKTCKGDDLVLEEVLSLIAESDEAEEFLEEPLFYRASETATGLPQEGHCGPYRLLEPLGRGGMGAVYLAERKDQEFEQRVAIKLIRRGLDSEEIVQRFRYERQILANLQHPNIAHLLDGGATDEGIPYFVLEHVEGEPIHRYCEKRRLSITETLKLFRSVCDAVGFAHQNLVIHRDLKPANILVNSEGMPKLLDFGIAKLLTPDNKPQETLAALGGRFLTPEYASPEQLRGEPVTTASDVYSLGVVLYRLLTGSVPFSAPSTLTPAALYTATLERQREPLRPSRVTGTKPGLGSKPSSNNNLKEGSEPTTEQTTESHSTERAAKPPRLPKDLDFIALKALRFEPQDRYLSVRELAEDIDRHLAGWPVMARQGSQLYRFGKFVRRRRGQLVAAVVLLSLLVSLGFNNLERRRSDEVARESASFAFELLSAADQEAQGQRPTFLDILDRGLEKIDEAMQSQPLQRATFMARMGQIYRGNGELTQARDLLEKSLELRQRNLKEDDLKIARSHHSLSNVLWDLGDYEAARDHLLEAQGILERLSSSESMGFASVLDGLGGVAKESGNLADAERWYRESLEIRRRLLGEGDHKQIALGLNDLGWTLATRGKYQEANEMLEEALAIERRRFPEVSDSPLYLRTLTNLASVRRDLGRLNEAERMFRESLALRQERYSAGHHKIASVLKNLALCLQLGEDLESAETLYRQALRMRVETYGEEHDKVADVRRDLATLLTAKGDFPAAETEARQALGILSNKFLPDHWRIADARSVLGGCLLGLGMQTEAEVLIRSSYSQLREHKGASSRQALEALARLQQMENLPAR